MNKILKILLIVDVAVVNAGVGYLIYKSQVSNSKSQTSPNFQIFNDQNERVVYQDRCGEECMAAVAARVEELESKRAGVVGPTGTPKPTVKPAAGGVAKKVRREEIMTIPGSGSTSGNDWTNLVGTEFYFDTRDYPGLVEVYFEASMKLVNGNGTAYVRLYDVTNVIAVNGAQNDTSSQSDVWTKSQRVYFWAGRNLIRVQGKSLTADTAVFNTGKLRIVTEN